MGCDIHDYVEVKKDGVWRAYGEFVRDEDGVPDTAYGSSLYGDRNYNLFAILANVRNGRGFAGCVTGTEFNPIAEPRGLPEDVTPEIKAVSDSWDGDGHSHSWLMLDELLDYDWTQTHRNFGVVSLHDFWDWNRYKRGQGIAPDNYSGGIMGPRIEVVSMEKAEQLIADTAKRFPDMEYWQRNHAVGQALEATDTLGPCYYVEAQWEWPYAAAAHNFFVDSMPTFLKLRSEYDAVRLVFWFDN